jgi:hypothetical protein
VIFDEVIFDEVIFNVVIFDKVIFDEVIFDEVIFDEVIFDEVSDSRLPFVKFDEVTIQFILSLVVTSTDFTNGDLLY